MEVLLFGHPLLPARIWARLEVRDGCWHCPGDEARPWQRVYPGVHWRGMIRTLHRLSHGLFLGPLPFGHVPDHLCRNHRCSNPSHLEAVTFGENIRRGREPFDPGPLDLPVLVDNRRCRTPGQIELVHKEEHAAHLRWKEAEANARVWRKRKWSTLEGWFGDIGPKYPEVR